MEEKKNEKMQLTREDMQNATGGDGYFVWKEGGGYEYWFACSYCGEYRELFGTGTFGVRTGIHLEGTFVCPKCGWHRNYDIDL